MQYNSGDGLIMPTSNPLDFESGSLITFPAEVSHPHMALQNGNEVLVPDLVSFKFIISILMFTSYIRAQIKFGA